MKETNRGKQMKSVWTIPPPEPWEKKFGKHPTQKPVALLERILLASTSEGDVVLDPFAGSGTTLLTAFRLRCKAVGCELSAEFLTLSLRRLCSNLVQVEISVACLHFSVDPPSDPNFFCPVCKSQRLDIASRNTAAIDYLCPKCDSPFQLKSQSKAFGNRIVDAAYSEMKRAILSDRTPNLYVLHYDLTQWAVRTVILIPHFAFALSAIECRPALGPNARRAGWIGCNILLNKIPADARIPIVESGQARAASEVRRAYKRLRPLENLKVETRGWTRDVLNVVRSFNKKEFSLADVYAHSNDLAKLHPKNAHIPDKIRQQLQVLRDMGLVQFLGDGQYRLS